MELGGWLGAYYLLSLIKTFRGVHQLMLLFHEYLVLKVIFFHMTMVRLLSMTLGKTNMGFALQEILNALKIDKM